MASFAGRSGTDDVAIICRNTTEAINHLAYRLGLGHDDVVVTTVVEHHANLLPWSRVTRCRYVECDATGTFDVDAVGAALEREPRLLLAVTGASNVTGWVPPIDEIIGAANDRGVPVLVDAAQLAPRRPLPRDADYRPRRSPTIAPPQRWPSARHLLRPRLNPVLLPCRLVGARNGVVDWNAGEIAHSATSSMTSRSTSLQLCRRAATSALTQFGKSSLTRVED